MMQLEDLISNFETVIDWAKRNDNVAGFVFIDYLQAAIDYIKQQNVKPNVHVSDVRKGLESLWCLDIDNECFDVCTEEKKQAVRDAIALLKEQEPVEAKIMGESKSYGSRWFVCGACGHAIDVGDNYCRECGKAVKWE